jgi:hypothetical protein
LWTVPAARMKAEREHTVPLSTAAMAVLTAVRPDEDPQPKDYVFTTPLGQRFATGTMLRRVRMLAPGVTTHGFRSTFRDWAGDRTTFPREVAEAAIAHSVGDETEQAYRRGTALTKRRQLMEAWAAFCAGDAGNVVNLPRPEPDHRAHYGLTSARTAPIRSQHGPWLIGDTLRRYQHHYNARRRPCSAEISTTPGHVPKPRRS